VAAVAQSTEKANFGMGQKECFLMMPPGIISRSSPNNLAVIAVKYNESEDFVDRKVNTQVLQGKL